MVDCTYCGIQANALDHIIPVSYNSNSPGKRKSSLYNKEETVPVCTECNSHLNNFWLPTISQRAGHLLEKYNIKYRKLLNQPDWDDWELEDMGGTLKLMIQSNKIKKEILIERLNHLLIVYQQEDLTPFDIWEQYPEDIFYKFK